MFELVLSDEKCSEASSYVVHLVVIPSKLSIWKLIKSATQSQF